MRRTKFVLMGVLAVALVAAVAMPAAARMGGAGWAGRGMARGACMGPQFTEEQQQQIQKIQEKYDAQRVDLSNRLGVLRTEMQDLVAAEGEPDFKAIEKKMEDISAVRLELNKLRLRIHQDIRPLLTDDQKTLFDKGLGFGMMRGMAGGRCHMRGGAMGGRGRACGMMGQGPGAGMGMHAPMIGQTPGAMRGGMNQGWVPGPYCPFQGDAPGDDDAEDGD
jgi:Spy/CpxP family protein refolding chaperone